jgi:uncharacterized membrane-anchored protein YitT (DUF2179 family)
MRGKIRNILGIVVGSAIMGFGINFFNIANGLAEGGIIGITVLLKFFFDWNPALVNLLLNIPLLFLGWKVLGRMSFIYTLIGTVSLSIFLIIFANLALPLQDPLLASIFAGVTVGMGLGIVFRFGGTSDGIDIIALLCNKYMGWTIGRTVFLADLFIIVLSLVYLDITRAMYTLVTVFIGAKVIDLIQEGAYAAKAVTIISDLPAVVSKEIVLKMNRSTTLFNGIGGYSGENKEVIYCVVSRNEVRTLKSIVHDIDPHAFVIVNDVYEVVGQGFTSDEHKQPLM